MGEEFPEGAIGKSAGNSAEVEHFGDHEEHNKAAVGIERDEARRGGGDDGFGIDLFGGCGGRRGGSGHGWRRFSRCGRGGHEIFARMVADPSERLITSSPTVSNEGDLLEGFLMCN